MDVLVRILTVRRSGSVSARDHEVACDAIGFGRDADNEVHLPDPRIPLDQAVLQIRPEGLYLDSYGTASTSLDGEELRRPNRTGIVGPGSVIQLGPYEIKLIDPPTNVDVALTVQLTQPLGIGLDRLMSHSQTSLADTWASPRRFAWGLSLLIVSLFLIWPVVDFFLTDESSKNLKSPFDTARAGDRVWPVAGDLAWITGEISLPHKFLEENCNACHRRPFERVTDAVCVACHAQTRHHVDPVKYDFKDLTAASCQSCHKEHQGSQHIVRKDEIFCGGCHEDLQQTVKDLPLLNVGSFGNDHPEFRPTVLVDVRQNKHERVTLDPEKWPVERSNLRFPHDKHLDPKGIRVPAKTERRVLKCGDCHVPQEHGVTMRPISMEKHCGECHRLQFEATRPERTVPHGDVELVVSTLREFYRAMALAGGGEHKDAPPTLRRRPGTPLTEPQRLEALAWADRRANNAAEFVFGKSVCKTCHTVSRVAGKGGMKWNIEPVSITPRWMPKGMFDHRAHETTACVQCHDAPDSKVATDVLLPQIALCQTCHGGEFTEARVPSTCVMCHLFHQPSLPPMRPNLTKVSIESK